MSPFAAILLLAGTASVTSDAYPAAEVWAAVDDFCASTNTVPTSWQAHNPEPKSTLHYLAKPTRDRDYELLVFESDVAGRKIYTLTYQNNDQKWCWAYDFDMLDAPRQSQWTAMLGEPRSIYESEFTSDFRFSRDFADAAIISQRPGYTPHADAVGFHGLKLSQVRRR